MSFLRALFKVPALFVFSAVIALLHTLTRASLGGDPARQMRMRSRWMRLWGRGGLWILGGRIEIEGHPPDAPFLLVSNHLSYVDILLLSAGTQSAHFISRADVANWPLIGPVASAGQTIFIDRDRWRDLPQVVEQIRSILQQEGGVVFFPEATTSGGAHLLPFRAALFEAPVQTDFDVFCACISYETTRDQPPASESICWWRDMDFLPHLWGLAGLSQFVARLRFSAVPCRGAERRELAAKCRQEIELIFQPSTQPEAAVGDFEEHVDLNLSLLSDLRGLLESMTPESYVRRWPELRSEGVGAHVRHALDFYGALLSQMDADRVDYDVRPREEEIERDLTVALARIDAHLEGLRRLATDCPLRVAHDARDGEGRFSDSSLQRELRFVAAHLVHHSAIMALLLRLDGMDVESDFGIAPSTLEHMRRLGLGSS